MSRSRSPEDVRSSRHKRLKRRHSRSPNDSHSSSKEKRLKRRQSRSRSPRDRDREKDRERDRDRDKDRERDYGREKDRERAREKSREKDREHRDKSRKKKRHKKKKKEKIDLESVANADEEMMRQMGFGGFNTTKGKKVEGNIEGVAKVNKPRKYRQYMNRKGGFNRPLDYIA